MNSETCVKSGYNRKLEPIMFAIKKEISTRCLSQYTETMDVNPDDLQYNFSILVRDLP